MTSRRHPLFALAGRLGMVAGAAAAVAGIAVTLLPPGPAAHWYGRRLADQLAAVASTDHAVVVGRGVVETAVAATAGPAAWVLAGWLLRAAAVGRVRAVGVRRSARWPALAAVWLAAVAGGEGVYRWLVPNPYTGEEWHLWERVRQGVGEGRVCDIDTERRPGHSPSYGASTWGTQDTPADLARRVAVVACGEAVLLFACLHTAGLLFFAAATVYCLSAPPGDPDT